jgi:hypothetical protein
MDRATVKAVDKRVHIDRHGARIGFLVGAALGATVVLAGTSSNRHVWLPFLAGSWGAIGALVGWIGWHGHDQYSSVYAV